MSRKRTLLALFCVALPTFLIATIPLSFALKLIDAPPSDVSWQTATGTIWKGRLSDVSVLEQYQLGDINLIAKPLALFAGTAGYSLTWKDSLGEGTGGVFLGRNKLRISDLDLQVNFAGLGGLLPEIRRTNGVVKITNANISFKDNICVRADGNVSTDALTKLALQFNLTAENLEGNISCRDEALYVKVEGKLAQNDIVVSEARFLLNGASSLNVHVKTADAVLQLGLLRYGFEEDATGYIFQRDLNLAAEGRQSSVAAKAE